MSGAGLNLPDVGMGHFAIFRRLPQLALTMAILVADISFFSNIVTPSCTWGQRLLEVGCTIVGYGALRWRNSSPVLAYGLGWVYTAGSALLTIRGVFAFTPFFVLLVNLFAIATERSLRVSCAALAASTVPSALVIWFNVEHQAGPGYQLSTFIASTVFYLVVSAEAWAVGRRSRSARVAVEQHQRRLALAGEAAREERLRIARELHDILAHTVTVMVLQASGARRVLASDPAGADDALSRVEEVGKTAMSDLRRMLAVVRSPASNNEEPCQSGLADITGLLDGLLRAGVTARLEELGSPAPVAESVGRTVYRIVQEAATNIVKHAGPGTTALVQLAWGPDLRIEIVDDGGGMPVMEAGAFSTGHGLLGLAERVAVFGGTFSAGPHHDGFRVLACLPLHVSGSDIPLPYPENEEVT